MHPRKRLLPVELWCFVFSYLPLRDRLAIMLVCHSWRKIALDATSALWTQIRWNSAIHHVKTLQARLTLAGSALIDLCVEFPGYYVLDASKTHNYFGSIVQLLRKCIPQLRSLELHVSGIMPAEEFDQITDILTTTRAPHLEQLILECPMLLHDALFHDSCPKLRHVSLDGVTLHSRVAKYSQVSTLVFTFRTLQLPCDIYRILITFPSLEVLQLGAFAYKKSLNPHNPIPCWPSRFRTLMLHCHLWESLASEVMNLIPHASVQNIEYVVWNDKDWSYFPIAPELDLFSDLQAPELHAAFQTYRQDGTHMFELCFEDKAGFRRVFDAPHKVDTPHVAFAQDLTDGLFNMIATLDINEHDMVKLLLCRSARVELSNLSRLNLYLFDEREHREKRNSLTPFLVDDEYSLIVPQLAEVHFTAQDISYLAPEMVSRFVHRQLERGPRAWAPLDVVGFHNIRLLQNPVDAVAIVLRLATDFQFTMIPLTWISAKINELPEDDIDFS